MERIQAALKKARSLQPPEAVASGGDRAAERWARLPVFVPDPDHLEAHRILTFASDSPDRAVLDTLASRLLRYMRGSGWTALGMTSPTAGCGKSTILLNVAFALARLPGLRTLLVDLDFRRPSIARMLGFTGTGSVPSMIRGERAFGEGLVRVGERLALGLNSAAEERLADLLLGRRAPEVLKELRRQFQPDLVLYDLPPMLTDDGVLAIAQCLDAVLLTVAAGESHLDQVSACEAELSGSCPLIGVVLNKCQYL